MPEEIEVETKDLQETIDELREEREERAKETLASGWTRYLSLTTAILAVVAAVCALQAGKLVNEAILSKNEAVLKQAEASDQWAYYQAKGVKANGALQTAAILEANPAAADRAAKWAADAERYKKEQEKISDDAKEFQAKSKEAGNEANELVEHHELFAYAVTLTQVAIALSAIAALTRRKPVWYLSLIAGAFGIFFMSQGFAKHVSNAVNKSSGVEHSVGEAKSAKSGESATSGEGGKASEGAKSPSGGKTAEGGKAETKTETPTAAH